MEAYSHIVVVMSILMGLALTQLLRGVAQLYRARARVRPYWLHSAWIVVLVLLSFVLWWTYWNYRDVDDWNIVRFVLYLAPTIIFYFLTAIAFPDPDEPPKALRDYYYANRIGFFGTLALYGVMAGITAIVVRGLPIGDLSNAFRLAMVGILAVAMRSRREAVHAVVLITNAILLTIFISLFHFRLA